MAAQLNISDEERSKRHSEVWDAVIGPALDKAMEPVRALKQEVPSELIHFTGAGALASILQNHRLRLSSVRASNDPLEVKHGLALARHHLRKFDSSKVHDRIFKEAVRLSLKGQLPDGKENPPPNPHVCCFSTAGSQKSVLHWALYGRGGSGFALVFDGPSLSSQGLVDLVPVVYKRGEQRKLLGDVLDLGRRTADEAGQHAMDKFHDDEWAKHTFMVTALAFGTAACYVAAVAKRWEFRLEKEWRLLAGKLLAVRMIGPGMRFAGEAAGPVIRTFFEFPFGTTHLKSVIVGPGHHHDLNVTAVRDLLDEYEFSDVDVRVGKVRLQNITG